MNKYIIYNENIKYYWIEIKSLIYCRVIYNSMLDDMLYLKFMWRFIKLNIIV